jgi:nicotinate-nucleotide--dimethylbenzimidazole phosphoribosyltransferase
MPEEFEDPIEAIKRRNEERARRLKERIASGEFDKFATPLEEVDETLPSGPEAIEAPESEFDLSSFPAPPEPAAISFDEEAEAAVSEAPPEGPPPAPPEMPPEVPPEAPPEFAPPLEEPAAVAPGPDVAPPPEGPSGDALAGLELTELDLEGVGEVIAPQAWDGGEALADLVPPVAPPEAPPLEEEVPAAVEVPPGLEIEVEPAAPPAEVLLPAGVEEEVPVAAVPEPEPELVAVSAEEPTLREEEAEAIKATIEEELREVPPAAPAMPPRPAEVPAAAEAPEAEIFIGIEVEGNKVRIERRNITLAAAVDLFKSIIDRYQNR